MSHHCTRPVAPGAPHLPSVRVLPVGPAAAVRWELAITWPCCGARSATMYATREHALHAKARIETDALYAEISAWPEVAAEGAA